MSRRSARTRRKRDESEIAPAGSSPNPNGAEHDTSGVLCKRSSSDPAAGRSKTRKMIHHDDPKSLFTHPKSRLVSADLCSMLSSDTWALLTPEDQSECISMLPKVDKIVGHNGQETIRPDFFNHNVFLQESMREFQDRLAAGHLMPSYLKKTKKATADRLAGKADAYKEEQFEEQWGVKQDKG